MRAPLILLFLLVPIGCAGGDDAEPAAEDDAPATTMEAAVTPADFAGTWELTARLEGTAEPVPVTIVGTEDGTFTMSLQERELLTMEVTMSGDSLVLVSPEYESVLRDGVMVSTRSAAVLVGDRMVGEITATYRTSEGTEVVSGTMEGERGM
jgi:hypothetical protein